ncbi:phage antirepressor protein [Escherichia coli]|nr:phage antirepressor protein [Escherichia coli]
MTSLKTSIKTITYLSDTGCLEIQGASLASKLYDIAFETFYAVTKNRDALLREVTRLDMSSSVIQRAMPMLKSLRARQFEL